MAYCKAIWICMSRIRFLLLISEWIDINTVWKTFPVPFCWKSTSLDDGQITILGDCSEPLHYLMSINFMTILLISLILTKQNGCRHFSYKTNDQVKIIWATIDGCKTLVWISYLIVLFTKYLSFKWSVI